MVRVKRVYSKPHAQDGIRILVDRVWPRGISKERARIAEWYRDVAPSTALRKWFGHDPARWTEFCKLYKKELKRPLQQEALTKLAGLCSRRKVTLVYGASDEVHNQAVVLKELLEKRA